MELEVTNVLKTDSATLANFEWVSFALKSLKNLTMVDLEKLVRVFIFFRVPVVALE